MNRPRLFLDQVRLDGTGQSEGRAERHASRRAPLRLVDPQHDPVRCRPDRRDDYVLRGGAPEALALRQASGMLCGLDEEKWAVELHALAVQLRLAPVARMGRQ